MAEPLYTHEILRLAMSLSTGDDIASPDIAADARAPICGSSVSVKASIDSGKVSKIEVAAKACAMGQASAAILMKHAAGRTEEEIAEIKRGIAGFLAGDAEMPTSWPDLDHLKPARQYPARHAAILLPYEALLRAFSKQHEGQLR